MNQFLLPDVGEGLTEAEIVTWRVAVGDTVEVNDVLVDIETAKSIVELPSPYRGVVGSLLVAEGETVAVGTPIITIGAADEGDHGAVEPESSATEQHPAEPAVEPGSGRQPVLVGYGPRTESAVRRRRRPAGPAHVASVDTAKVAQRTPPTLAKPPVRKLARDLGVALADVPTTGPVITRADVEAYARAEAEVTSPADASADIRVPITGVRKRTAEAMVTSAFTAPHVTEWITVDVSRTVDLVARLKGDPAFAGSRVSPTLIAATAICLAMRRTPELNATWDEAAQEIIVKGSVNLGIAAATDRGLLVPTIVGANALSMPQLAAALTEATDTARSGRAQPAQLSGGTFTLTNVGVFGVDAGTPILNPGQAGILALGSISRRPWVGDDDQIVPRWVTTLALSFDHRIVDGAQGSRFLADVAAIMHDPALGMTY